jgi:hypothetical protein
MLFIHRFANRAVSARVLGVGKTGKHNVDYVLSNSRQGAMIPTIDFSLAVRIANLQKAANFGIAVR